MAAAISILVLVIVLVVPKGNIAAGRMLSNGPGIQVTGQWQPAGETTASSVYGGQMRHLLQKRYQLSPDPSEKGCYMYRATAGDTAAAIASALGVSEADLKKKNSQIQDWFRLNGRFIQICNIKNFEAAEGADGRPLGASAGGHSAPAPAPAPAPAAAAPKPAPAAAPPKPAAAHTPAAAGTPAPAQAQAPGINIPFGTGVRPGIPGLPVIGRRHR